MCVSGSEWDVWGQRERRTGRSASAQRPVPHGRVCQEVLQRGTEEQKVRRTHVLPKQCVKMSLLQKSTAPTGCWLLLVFCPQRTESQKGEGGQGPCGYGQILQGKKWGQGQKCPRLCILVHVIVIVNDIVYCTAAQMYSYLVVCLSLQSPIHESLIDFSDSGMNRVAADIFLGERTVRKGAMDTDRR